MKEGAPTRGLELQERRRQREPIIRVWDRLVRLGHWTLVFCFAVIYLYYRKFPTHAYAGYLVIVLVLARLVWGFVGSRAARFSSFIYSPRETLAYALSMFRGGAHYYVSHNPMGALMVHALLSLMLLNGIVGLMVYSAGQQLGPLGNLVPVAWEDSLILAHKLLGHVAAACVFMHLAGVLFAARLHRENYVVAMFTGYKRVPRKTDDALIQGYPQYSENMIPPALRPLERWINHRYPFVSSALIVMLVIGVMVLLAQAVVKLNKYIPAY